jgi:uncharacterized protein DUF6599
MRRVIGLFIAVMCVAVWSARAQQILPMQVSGWTQPIGAVPVHSAAETPAILAEYGWKSTEAAVYGDRSKGFGVVLYVMSDPSGAYGLYSFFRTPDMARSSLTDHSSILSNRALVLVGDLVLDIHGADLPRLEPQLKELVASVEPKSHGGALPVLGEYLPQKNMIERTDRYVLGPQTLDQLFPGGIGNSVGLQSHAEAELAHYRLGGHDATLLLVDFPTDQLAQRQLEGLQKNFNVNGGNESSGAPLFAKRSARLLAIVAGASSRAEANILLDQIQMDTERSWNEPVPKHEPPIELMIEGSIIGSITICMFALIAGFSFGGLRLLTKRFMPGKIFDTKKHLQVLQLGLGSKAINSDDFYGYSAPSGPVPPVDKNLPDRVALRIFR